MSPGPRKIGPRTWENHGKPLDQRFARVFFSIANYGEVPKNHLLFYSEPDEDHPQQPVSPQYLWISPGGDSIYAWGSTHKSKHNPFHIIIAHHPYMILIKLINDGYIYIYIKKYLDTIHDQALLLGI